MQIYLRGCCLYDLDWQKAFGAKYLAGNPLASQEYRKYNKNNVEYKGNVIIKG